MKPVKNVTETFCATCAPDLFSKFCIIYHDGTQWRFTHRPRCTSHKKVLRRVEPRTLCHTPKDRSARWQFTLEDYNETD